MKSDLQNTLEKNGITVPQILCGLLCKPDETKSLYYLYKALEAKPLDNNLHQKIVSLRLSLGFTDQIELELN